MATTIDGIRRDQALQVGLRLAGLGLLLWGVSSEIKPGATHVAAWALAAALVPGWVAWSTQASRGPQWRLATFTALGLVGGALSVFAPLALAAVGTAALGAAIALDLSPALVATTAGPAATLITALADGRSPDIALGAVAAALAGTVLGVSRRQTQQRAAQEATMAVEHERAELAQARADVLAERNRLAREVHDVLAHTLGGLAVQLEALDAQLGSLVTAPARSGEPAPAPTPAPPPLDGVREGVRRTRVLAVEGLAEARRAVQALRDDTLPLDEQLGALCATGGSRLTVTGSPRPLAPDVVLALQRVARESLTNAAKHAPGAPVEMALRYEPAGVALTVENACPPGSPAPLAATGGGYGLDGMRERARLVGGSVEAAPTAEGGWRVDARVPA